MEDLNSEKTNTKNEWTSLMIKKQTKELLRLLKEHPRESFNSVLQRLIKKGQSE